MYGVCCCSRWSELTNSSTKGLYQGWPARWAPSKNRLVSVKTPFTAVGCVNVNYLNICLQEACINPTVVITLLQSELPAQKALLSTISPGNNGAHNPISPTVDKMYLVWTFIKMEIMTSLSHLTINFEQHAIQTEVPSFSTLTVGAWDQLPQCGVKKNLILRILKLC